MYCNRVRALVKTCVGCGQNFATSRETQTRCVSDCGRVRSSESRNGARSHARKNYIPEFIGVDGEGVTDADGTHRYVLLSVGERSLHREGEHLHFREIIEFLWECFLEAPKAVYCGYYLKYDFNQWLRTLPQDRAEILLTPSKRARVSSGGNTTPFPVLYGDEWEFDLLAMKRFKLRKIGAKPWMYICDVGGYFQQSFVASMSEKWLDKNGSEIVVVTPEERAIIEQGKARRSDARFDKAMMQYNCAENRVLGRMMPVLAQGFKEVGVTLTRSEWFGPGQVAQKWLDEYSTHNTKTLREKAENEPLFAAAMQAARQSYYGGWFETMAHGHVGDAFEYDISSAYPHIISQLPCLLHGTWFHHEGSEASAAQYPWALVRADVFGGNAYIGAMLHRDKNGRINRPLYTSGWFWKHELEAAQRAGLVADYSVSECYGYQPCPCAPPLHDLRQSFLTRHSVGKKTPYGRAIKLKDNSVYGKQAQSVGNPKHANPIYASLTTAGTRAMICDAIATHSIGAADVLMIATDGIYFRTRHPGLDAQPIALGNWEASQKRNLTIFLPGIYWDDAAREGRAANAVKLKSRGVSGRDLIERLDALDDELETMRARPIEWRMFEGDVAPEWWPKMSLPVGFSMVSAAQALQRRDWTLAGQVTQSSVRELWSHPRVKRELVLEPSAAFPFIRTTPPTNPLKLASTPYSKEFGMKWEEEFGDAHDAPDGDAEAMTMALVKGAML